MKVRRPKAPPKDAFYLWHSETHNGKKAMNTRISTSKLEWHPVNTDAAVVTGVVEHRSTLMLISTGPMGLFAEIEVTNMFSKFPGVALRNGLISPDKSGWTRVTSG